MPPDLPNIDPAAFRIPDATVLQQAPAIRHRPRILLLYGSLRERSFSRFAVEETARLLEAFGAETRIFDPSGLPLPDDAPATHPKVAAWSEAILSRPSMAPWIAKEERMMAKVLAG